MDIYGELEKDFETRRFIENNKEMIFSDIQDNKRRNITEEGNNSGTVLHTGESILQGIYTPGGILVQSKEQKGNSTEPNKERFHRHI